MMVRQFTRVYVVDEDDHVRPFSQVRFRRIERRDEAVYLFAGRTVRFATTVAGYDGAKRRFAVAYFTVLHFGPDGLIDEEAQRAESTLVARMALSRRGSPWFELYRRERDARFTWRPSKNVVAALRTFPLPAPKDVTPKPATSE